MERLLRKVVLRKGVIEIMKKAYVKPELYFENFELSSSIAKQCAQAIHYAAGTCNEGLGDFAKVLFIDNTCTLHPDDSGKWCYHVPTPAMVLINS